MASPSDERDTTAEPAKAKGTAPVKPAKSRVGATGADASSRRYTAPVRTQSQKPSPRWVPVLMFAFWGLGLLVIILNYMKVLPGTEEAGNGWYLVAGLGSILAGIITATQYR